MNLKENQIIVSMKFETVDPYDSVPRVLDFARKASLEIVGIVSITRAPKVHSSYPGPKF